MTHDATGLSGAVKIEADGDPASRVKYGERVLPIPDGLPKFRDMPMGRGGSGEMCAG